MSRQNRKHGDLIGLWLYCDQSDCRKVLMSRHYDIVVISNCHLYTATNATCYDHCQVVTSSFVVIILVACECKLLVIFIKLYLPVVLVLVLVLEGWVLVDMCSNIPICHLPILVQQCYLSIAAFVIIYRQG